MSDLTISPSSLFIGENVISGTSGSIPYIDSNTSLAQSNSNLFYDATNKRWGIGTSSPGATIEAMIPTASEIGLIIEGASSQSGDLVQLQNSSASVLTKFNSSADMTFNNTARTFSASTVIFASGTTTHTISAAIALTYFKTGETFNITADQAGFTGQTLFNHSNTYKNDPALTGNIVGLAAIGYNNAPIYQADTNATTMLSIIKSGGFHDLASFSRINSGTLTVTDWTSFNAGPSSATGVTITTRHGLFVANCAGGTITNHYGVRIADLANGGTTTTQSLRIEGTTGHNRIQNRTNFGSDATPSVGIHCRTGFALGVSAVTLTSDNQAVATADVSYLSISSNNATAANRDFVLNQSTVVGQILVLEWTGTNAGQMIDDVAQGGGGNTRLSANWVPTQFDTLTLISNGTDWIELCRSTN